MLHKLPVVYVHGMPGSPRELTLFGGAYTTERICAPDRTGAFDPDSISADVSARFPREPIRIVAFSLGVRSALDLATRRGSVVVSIDLVSPAAPLDTGDYRDAAGHLVFEMARTSPRLFSMLTAGQSLAARRAPALLYRQLFASAKGADIALARDPHFRATMMLCLGDSFAGGAPGYRAELQSFVTPWAAALASVRPPVTLWHGACDNWAPIAMTETLAARLPNVASINLLPELSHFSTLRFALDALLP